MTTNIQVLSFGKLADIVGEKSIAAKDTVELREMLETAHPALKTLSYRVAVNKKIVDTDIALKEGDAVALLPPFSGG